MSVYYNYFTWEEKFLREQESDPAKSKEGGVHADFLLMPGKKKKSIIM